MAKPEPEPGRAAGEKRLRIHYLVEDAAGPIRSGRARGTLPLGTDSRWRCACDPAIVIGTETDRGTNAPWGVRCDACRATEAFKKEDRPKPGLHGGSEQARQATGAATVEPGEGGGGGEA